MRDRQLRLFAAKAFVQDSDLGRLTDILDVLPDQETVATLQGKSAPQGRRRRHGARVLLHILVAAVVFRYRFLSEVLAELRRNSDLRDAVGLGPAQDVPRPYEMSRFLKRLVRHRALLDKMFGELVREIRTHRPDFGQHLAGDGTHIYTYARGKSTSEESADPQATWGVKKRRGHRADGSTYEKVTAWFGYKLHLLVDSVHELPLAYTVTTASRDEAQELLPMVDQARAHLEGESWSREQWQQTQQRWRDENRDRAKPERLSNIFEGVPLAYDKAADQRNIYVDLHQQYGAKAVIAMVEHWDKDANMSVYDRDRLTRVRHDQTGEWADLVSRGYEKDRETLKYLCPCDGQGRCPYFGAECNKKDGGRGPIIRIPLKENPRYYTAIARGTKKWKREYNRRTAVERVNSRLKQVLEIEHGGVRGQDKIAVRCGLGLLAMLAHAVACLRAGKPEAMRSMRQVA